MTRTRTQVRELNRMVADWAVLLVIILFSFLRRLARLVQGRLFVWKSQDATTAYVF